MPDPRRTHSGPLPQAAAVAGALPPVPSTLRIPLAGRALGDALFPHMAVQDAHAALTLAAIGDDGSRWVTDRCSMWGVLARTRHVCQQAQAFMQQHPKAHIVNVGCGLSQYFQWLDNGCNRMTDADLPQVVALRQRLLPVLNARHALLPVDLLQPHWWQQLHLPRRQGQPLFILLEGVSMYLDAGRMTSLLQTVGACAPSGSWLLLDAFSQCANGPANWHPSLCQTGVALTWGLQHPQQLAQAHPRLRLIGQFDIMAGYSWATDMWGLSFAWMAGMPFYAMYTLQVG